MSGPAAPEARVRRSKFSLAWLIPLVAIALVAWLGFRASRAEGPRITVTWKTGDGLVAGQTHVRHKAVDLGLVESVRLADDMQSVVVRIQMSSDAAPYLSDSARFWVVRPRLTSGSISGVETLVSGAYIEMDPGTKDGPAKTQYVGLESPPGVRSGEPGRTYKLKADRIGSLAAGAPVFYRDIQVGEVLGYDIGNGLGPVTVTVFVRSPYDGFVREGSHFWNASGLSVQLGGDGVHIEVASLQALLSGGVAFSAPKEATGPIAQPAPADKEFFLFPNYAIAEASGYVTRQPFAAFFTSSVKGLTKGAAVEFLGIQVGTVNDVQLEVNSQTAEVRVRVRFEIQPERIESTRMAQQEDPLAVARRLVAKGLRVQLKTGSFITGSMVLALDMAKDAPPGEVTRDGNDVILPSTGGGLDNILASVSDITTKLGRIPFDEIGTNLNGTLRGASSAMGGIQELVRHTDNGLTPVLNRLPAIVSALQDTVGRANRVLGSVDAGYGSNSSFNRELERALASVSDTARSIRLLADFLDRHPEALVRGRTN